MIEVLRFVFLSIVKIEHYFVCGVTCFNSSSEIVRIFVFLALALPE